MGKTKCSKRTRINAAAGTSVTLAVMIESTSPHNSLLVEETLVHSFPDDLSNEPIGIKAHESDPLKRHSCAACMGSSRLRPTARIELARGERVFLLGPRVVVRLAAPVSPIGCPL